MCIRDSGSTGRMNAKDVTISQGAFEGICQAADVLDLAWTSHQYRMWVREAYEAEDVPSVAAAYNNRVEVDVYKRQTQRSCRGRPYRYLS